MAPGISETIVLKDGTRIKVKEELLEDGSRRITREIVDRYGHKRVETEAFRGPFDAESSYLSLEEQQQYSHHEKSSKGSSSSSSSSSGWDSRMGDLVDTEANNQVGYHNHNHGADESTLTSGWFSPEETGSSTFYTKDSRDAKCHDGFTLSPSQKYHAAPRKYEDRLAFHSNTHIKNEVPPSPPPPPPPPPTQQRKKNTPKSSTRDRRVARFPLEEDSIEDVYSPTLGIAPQRSPKSQRPSPRQQRSPSQQQQRFPRQQRPQSSQQQRWQSQQRTPQRASPSGSRNYSTSKGYNTSPAQSSSSRKSPPQKAFPKGSRNHHKDNHHNKTAPPVQSVAVDRFSRHVDIEKSDPPSEFMANGSSGKKIFPSTESDLTGTLEDDGYADKEGGPITKHAKSTAIDANKSKRRWCNSWVMITIIVLLIGAIAGVTAGLLVPMLTRNNDKDVNSASTQDEAIGVEGSASPTRAPTASLVKKSPESTFTSSPTSEVVSPDRPTSSPTRDPCSHNLCEWNRIGKSLTGDNYGDAAGTSTAISADGKMLAVGGVGTAETGGFAKFYVLHGSSWVQRGQTIEGSNKNDRFGLSIALSADGHVAAIGGDGWDGEGVNKGVVRVYKYKRQESKWVQLGNDFEGDASFDRAGWSVSLSASGHVLAYGAPGSDSGYSRVFHWTGSTWRKRGDDIKLGDRSGQAIDLSADGSVLAVGSVDESYAYVFEWNKRTWQPRGEMLVGRSGTSFGAAIKLSSSGDIVAVSSPDDGSLGPNSGLVTLFSWNSIEWEPIGKIYGSFDSDYAGSSIALDSSGLDIAVGSPGRGITTLYEWKGGTRWVSRGSFESDVDVTSIGSESRPVFSVALSSSAKMAAVGSASAGDGGSVTVYQFDVAAPSQPTPVPPTALPPTQAVPVQVPTKIPSKSPTKAPPTKAAQSPTQAASKPSKAPVSTRPTARPSKAPTTAKPSALPTYAPSPHPTRRPTKPKPTRKPTKMPTARPTKAPVRPTPSPVTSRPSPKPTFLMWNQIGEAIHGEESGEYIGTSTSLSANGNTFATGGTWDGYGLGIVRIYVRDGSSWSQLGQTLEGSSPGDHFGSAIKLSNDGRTIVVGSGLDNDNGSIHIYQYSKTLSEWVQRGSSLKGNRRSDQAGWSVAMSAAADVVAFGAPGSGYTRVYAWNGNRWVRRGGDIDIGDRSGHSISLNGDGKTLAIGALDGSYVKCYRFNGSNWKERGQAISGEESTYFGASVSLSRTGNELAVGAPYDTRVRSGSAAGLARVYVWDGSIWVQQGQDLYGMGSFYYFGQIVSLSSTGTVLAVGSPGPRWGDVPSTVHIFDWDSSARSWILRGDAVSSGDSSAYGTSSEIPSFSMAMSLNGKTVAIAAPLNGEKGRAAGKVKVFQWPG